MNVKIDRAVFKKFNPKLKIAFILAENIDNKNKLKESKHLLADAMQMARLTFHKETIKNHYLVSPWAVAQEEFGKKAKHYHTSVERLLKKVLKGRTITTNNTLTNIIRYLAIKHIVPFGIDDPYKIQGDLNFKIATGKEKVDLLRKLLPNTLYYRDNNNILGTKLDHWKSSDTALAPYSTSALIHLDILPPLTAKKAREIIKEAKTLIETFCGGKTSTFNLSKTKSSQKI
jgi:DNA/RNA-binding domain of Phe-tRNA-synthetase-like protein